MWFADKSEPARSKWCALNQHDKDLKRASTVCDDYFDNTDATVACKQLRYTTGTAHGSPLDFNLSSAVFGQGVC